MTPDFDAQNVKQGGGEKSYKIQDHLGGSRVQIEMEANLWETWEIRINLGGGKNLLQKYNFGKMINCNSGNNDSGNSGSKFLRDKRD